MTVSLRGLEPKGIRPALSIKDLDRLFTIDPHDGEMRWRATRKPAGCLTGHQISVGGWRYGLAALYRRLERHLMSTGELSRPEASR